MLGTGNGGASRRNDPGTLTPIAVPINYETDYEGGDDDTSCYKKGFEAVAMTVAPAVESEPNEEKLASTTNMKALTMPKYLGMLQEVVNLQRVEITIELDDLIKFDEKNDELVERVMKNTTHYLNLFSVVLDGLLPSSNIPVDMATMDVIDVIVSHRRARQQALVGEGGGAVEGTTSNNGIPATLLRRYQLYFKPLKTLKPVAVRSVRADDVGSLVRVKGILTRVTEVRPLLQVGTYTCEKCGWEVYQEIMTQAFMPLPECPTEECKRNQSKGQLVLQSRGSKFQKFQEARIQELTEQVPMGHIPRSMAVVLTGDLTRTINPGDQVILGGIYMPKPYTGFKAIKAGLLTDTYLLVQHIEQLKPKYESKSSPNSGGGSLSSNDDAFKAVQELGRSNDIYSRLAQSIAPEIYGHLNLKKALLLLMVGGLTREMEDGMKIRGDINICLMGDPGVAKSQLLKYITKIAPRAVYTTGKGSSGVGLTASVTKDPITGEMVLEGGALVLADNGICCIDEFDKMDETDRTAIHEVMEQQTISISKAGITTTLNARTSILAAANPLYGRYNPKKSPRENINLPPALLSRFDLLFLILDSADVEEDTRLAEHVCQVHRTCSSPTTIITRGDNGGGGGDNSNNNNNDDTMMTMISPEMFRLYVGTAKTFNPIIPNSLIEYVVGAYVGLRLNDLNQKDTTYTTPRTLLAVLRLSQALARIRFCNTVNQADIDEAMRLMEVSRSSVDIHLEAGKTRPSIDPTTAILSIIREVARNFELDEGAVRIVPIDIIRDSVRSRGYSDTQLQSCLVAFDECNIWSVSSDGTTLKIFN